MVCDRDERGKCTVRVGFLAVFVAVKLQEPKTPAEIKTFLARQYIQLHKYKKQHKFQGKS